MHRPPSQEGGFFDSFRHACGVLSQYGADYVALSQALEGIDVQMVPYDQTVELGADLISGKVTLMVTGGKRWNC